MSEQAAFGTGSEPVESPASDRSYGRSFIEALHYADVRIVTAVPESRLKDVFQALPNEDGIRYVPVTNESEMPGVVAGAYFGGVRAMMLMENSGLRQACEPITRFAYAHKVPLVMAVTHRGEFGEPNWWGHNHSQVMIPLLEALRIPYQRLSTIDSLSESIDSAFVHADASQWPVCLILEGECVADVV